MRWQGKELRCSVEAHGRLSAQAIEGTTTNAVDDIVILMIGIQEE